MAQHSLPRADPGIGAWRQNLDKLFKPECLNVSMFFSVLCSTNKCVYTLETCPLNKSDTKALFSSFIKIIRTYSKDVVDQCTLLFECASVVRPISVNQRKVIIHG